MGSATYLVAVYSERCLYQNAGLFLNILFLNMGSRE